MLEHPNEQPKGGETFNEFKVRILREVRPLFQRAAGNRTAGSIVIVTHGKVLLLVDAWVLAGMGNSLDAATMRDLAHTTHGEKIEFTRTGAKSWVSNKRTGTHFRRQGGGFSSGDAAPTEDACVRYSRWTTSSA